MRRVNRLHGWGVSLQSRCRCVTTVAVAMSGGIDSAVSALLLKQQGYAVSGVFMRNWDQSDESGSGECPLHQDQIDMKDVCKRLGIESIEVSFVKEYWNNVFSPFVSAYESGMQTPNPDVYCNRHIKFNSFRKHVLDELGFDLMATGHYARVEQQEHFTGHPLLLRGLDPSKDQSYFLCCTEGRSLSRVLFPLGNMLKSEVRKLAAACPLFEGLRVLQKRESMGVCFIGKRRMDQFLPNYLNPTRGRFIDLTSGKQVGEHAGAELLTLGQKARIGGSPEKYFVARKSRSTGNVYVAGGSRHPSLFCEAVEVLWDEFNWVAGEIPSGLNSSCEGIGSMDCEMQFRHQQTPLPCTVTLFRSTVDIRDDVSPLSLSSAPTPTNICRESSSGRMVLRIDSRGEPMRAPAPGQILALYSGDICLGGGPIRQAYSTYFN